MSRRGIALVAALGTLVAVPAGSASADAPGRCPGRLALDVAAVRVALGGDRDGNGNGLVCVKADDAGALTLNVTDDSDR